MAKPIQANPTQRPVIPAPPKLTPNTDYGLLNPPQNYSLEAGENAITAARNQNYSLEPGEDAITASRNAGKPPLPSGTGPDVDWAQVYFGQYGLPSDIVSQIESLGKQYGTTNPDVFMQSAQNLIRGSDWFKVTYPGFSAGVTAGLFTDETGYRGYVNSLNSVYQQYLGRAVSGDETAAALAQGASPTLIGNQFQGDAIAKTNANDWNYLTGAFDTGPLSAAEQTAGGREQAGIDTSLGQMVQKRIAQAQQRASTLFGGRLATTSLGQSAGGRLVAPSLGTGSTPDIAS